MSGGTRGSHLHGDTGSEAKYGACSAGVLRGPLEDGPRLYQRQISRARWVQVAPGHGEFTGCCTPSPRAAAGRRKPHEGVAAGAGAALESSPSTPWHCRGPILPPSTTSNGTEQSMGMLPAAPHPQLPAPVPQSSAVVTPQGPGLSPRIGSPDPLPSTPKLGAVGAVTPGSHSRNQLQVLSSISAITPRVVDKDSTAQGAEEAQAMSGAQGGCGGALEQGGCKGGQPHRRGWGCHKQPRPLQVGGEFPPGPMLHVRQRFHSEGVLTIRKM